MKAGPLFFGKGMVMIQIFVRACIVLCALQGGNIVAGILDDLKEKKDLGGRKVLIPFEKDFGREKGDGDSFLLHCQTARLVKKGGGDPIALIPRHLAPLYKACCPWLTIVTKKRRCYIYR